MSFSIWDEDMELSKSDIRMLRMSLLPEYQWQEDELIPDECDIATYDRLNKIRNNLDDFLGNKINNIVICGKNLGCGKTSWALKLLLTYFEICEPRFVGVDSDELDRGLFDIGIFLQTAPFLVKMKQFGGNDDAYKLYQRLEKTEFAVFDDISAVHMSNYDYNILYALVETRVFAHLPCIYTTNITSKEKMEELLGPRLADRIWEKSLIIELKGSSYRGSK